MRRKTENAIMKMKTTKVKRCPVCGEQLYLFDQKHVREKHLEYLHIVRKWKFIFAIWFISWFVFLIINRVFFQDWPIGLLAAIGNLIAALIGLFSALKWRSATKKYKLLWKGKKAWSKMVKPLTE